MSSNDDNTDGSPERGVLYIATNDRYVNEVFESVETLKRETDLHCTLITDEQYEHDLVDEIVVEDNPEDRPDSAYKLYNVHRSPYERTLYLDSDTHVRSDVSSLFDVLDDFDLALTHAPVRNTDRLPDLPAWFPEYNCGVMLYDTGATRDLFAQWRRNYEEMSFDLDQPSFRKTLFESDDVEFFTLLREYNVRFWPGFVDEEVRIVHTHLDNRTIADAFARTSGPRAYYYHDNEIVIEQNTDSLRKRLVDSLRDDGIAATAAKALNRLP